MALLKTAQSINFAAHHFPGVKPYEKRAPHQVGLRYKAPDPTVTAVIPIVAHHKVVALWHHTTQTGWGDLTALGITGLRNKTQGHPVIIQAGGSESGQELSARVADVVFTAQNDLDEALAFRRALAGEIGRDIHRAAVDLRPTALDDLGLREPADLLLQVAGLEQRVETRDARSAQVEHGAAIGSEQTDARLGVLRLEAAEFHGELKGGEANRLSPRAYTE